VANNKKKKSDNPDSEENTSKKKTTRKNKYDKVLLAECLAKGMTNKEIAKKMGVKENTAQKWVAELLSANEETLERMKKANLDVFFKKSFNSLNSNLDVLQGYFDNNNVILDDKLVISSEIRQIITTGAKTFRDYGLLDKQEGDAAVDLVNALARLAKAANGNDDDEDDNENDYYQKETLETFNEEMAKNEGDNGDDDE